MRAVAAAGGRLHAEELIEILWPGVDPERGRNRLRNLLSRLRMAAGDVLVREEETITAAPGTESDAAVFETQARAALIARSAGEASRALGPGPRGGARYGGDFLPGRPLRGLGRQGCGTGCASRYVELLDMLADDAAARGEVDEAARLIRRGCECEPLDEDRHVRLARMLASQGRAGSALAALERARAALAELGLAPARALEDLRSRTGPPQRRTRAALAARRCATPV